MKNTIVDVIYDLPDEKIFVKFRISEHDVGVSTMKEIYREIIRQVQTKVKRLNDIYGR